MTSPLSNGLAQLQALELQVKQLGACSLDGVSICFEKISPLIYRAMDRGFVSRTHGLFVLNGLWNGFDLGVDLGKVRGKQRFRNYPSALSSRRFVSKATRGRVADC